MRVFEVPEPVGPWTTVLVYLPRNRFTAELPERIADAVATAYGADRRTFEPYLGASSLARIAVSVRRPDGAEPRRPRRPRAARRRAVDVVVRPAARRARRRASARRRRATLFERVGAHAPAAYRAAVPPERADHDVRRIAALLDGDAELTTSLGHDVDAPPGEWRFRVYRRGAPAALSELLPLLDHLGLQALDEQPYTFRPRRRAGVRLRHRRPRAGRRRARRAAARPPCRRPSPRSSPAPSRATGSTGSCCGPG